MACRRAPRASSKAGPLSDLKRGLSTASSAARSRRPAAAAARRPEPRPDSRCRGRERRAVAAKGVPQVVEWVSTQALQGPPHFYFLCLLAAGCGVPVSEDALVCWVGARMSLNHYASSFQVTPGSSPRKNRLSSSTDARSAFPLCLALIRDRTSSFSVGSTAELS